MKSQRVREPPSHACYLKCLTILRRQTGNYQVFTGWNALQRSPAQTGRSVFGDYIKLLEDRERSLTTRLMCLLPSRNKNEGGGLQKSHSFCFLKTAGLEGAFCPQYWADPPPSARSALIDWNWEVGICTVNICTSPLCCLSIERLWSLWRKKKKKKKKNEERSSTRKLSVEWIVWNYFRLDFILMAWN